MAVDFDRDRMEAVLDAHERWWRGELDRPLVKVVLEKDLPRVRALCWQNCPAVSAPTVTATMPTMALSKQPLCPPYR